MLEGSGPNSKGRIMLTEFNECFPKQWHFILVYIYKGKEMVPEIGDIKINFKYLGGRNHTRPTMYAATT